MIYSKITAILFPNLKMNAEKLEFTLRKPFDIFMNFKEYPNWLPWRALHYA
jgi:hypothetical protein